MNTTQEGLTSEQLQSLDTIYQDTYVNKYKVIGYLRYTIEEGDEAHKEL